MKLNISAQTFLQLCINQMKLPYYHIDYGDYYLVFAYRGCVVWTTTITEGKTGYNYYKNNLASGANQP